MAAFKEITPANLMRLIGTLHCPVIVDVCIDEDFACDPHLIPSAFRHSHKNLDGLLGQVLARDVVVVCQKKLKVSQGVAAYLRAQGISAQIVTGGNIAWRDAGLPRVPAAVIPPSLWVTRHCPKIDRIASPSLIRRFVDPRAQFLFVPPSDVAGVAERFDATPFDTDIVPWTHVGEKCTFDVTIDAFGLAHPALAELALIVRSANTDRHDLAPQAAGLLAISVGLSRMFRDDARQLDTGMLVFDAIYRWARDGQDEGHDWTKAAAQ
jgi:rhodanese-related sulfurtransferase